MASAPRGHCAVCNLRTRSGDYHVALVTRSLSPASCRKGDEVQGSWNAYRETKAICLYWACTGILCSSADFGITPPTILCSSSAAFWAFIKEEEQEIRFGRWFDSVCASLKPSIHVALQRRLEILHHLDRAEPILGSDRSLNVVCSQTVRIDNPRSCPHENRHHPLTRTDKAGLLGSQQQSGRYLTALLRVSHVFHPSEGLIPSTRPAEFHYR